MITLDKVSKSYVQGNKALSDVTLNIEKGEFVFVVGASGSGKTTFIKLLLKEIDPTSGSITINEQKLERMPRRKIPKYRRGIGVVFQDFRLLKDRNVYENVAFALEIAGMSGREIRKTVPKVLELVDLLDQAKKFPAQLSGGQQQRVSIARSVARQPKILIADEPTANLDKLTTAEIIALLKKINDFGTTVLVSTHDESVVNTLQKRVITLKDGKVVNDQKANGIYKLDAAPMPKAPMRQMQVPGHALRPKPIVVTTKPVVPQPVAKPSVAAARPVMQPQQTVTTKRPVITKAVAPKNKRKVI